MKKTAKKEKRSSLMVGYIFNVFCFFLYMYLCVFSLVSSYGATCTYLLQLCYSTLLKRSFIFFSEAQEADSDSSTALLENSDDTNDLTAVTEEIKNSSEILVQVGLEDINVEESDLRRDEAKACVWNNSQNGEKTDTNDEKGSEENKGKSTKKHKSTKLKSQGMEPYKVFSYNMLMFVMYSKFL